MSLSRRVMNLSRSATLAVTAKAKRLKAEGVDVSSFGAGEPDFDTPEFIKEAAIKAIRDGFTKYTPSTGAPALKQAIQKKFQEENHLEYSLDQIVVGNGAKHSLFNIIQVICEQGDEIIIPGPYWVSYPQMVLASEGVPITVKTGAETGYKLTPDLLQRNITDKTRAVIINSPSNPTGVVYSRAELTALAELAVDRGLYLISDEIYEQLVYDQVEHVSVASLSDKIFARTFTVNGVSKAYSMTGWRIGYLAGPQEEVEKISQLQDHSTSCPNSIAQMAALAALEAPKDSVRQMREEFLRRRDYMLKRISAMSSLTAIKPSGAFYVFCDISLTGLDSAAFATRLLEEARVAVIPGAGFGYDRFIRLSFASSLEQIAKGLDRLENWLKTR